MKIRRDPFSVLLVAMHTFVSVACVFTGEKSSVSPTANRFYSTRYNSDYEVFPEEYAFYLDMLNRGLIQEYFGQDSEKCEMRNVPWYVLRRRLSGVAVNAHKTEMIDAVAFIEILQKTSHALEDNPRMEILLKSGCDLKTLRMQLVAVDGFDARTFSEKVNLLCAKLLAPRKFYPFSDTRFWENANAWDVVMLLRSVYNMHVEISFADDIYYMVIDTRVGSGPNNRSFYW